MSPGGDGLNEATVLAGLGKKVELRTILGDDMAGDILWNYCRKNKIHLSKDAVRPGMVTGINVVLVQKNGERNFLTNANGSLRQLCVEDVGQTFDDDSQILCFASIFVFPKIQTKELKELFMQAKQQGLIVCADMTKCKNGEKIKDIAAALPYLDYLFPNEEEAFLVTGEKSPQAAADAFFNAGVKNVVIKCGARGCYIRSDRQAKMISGIPAVKCVDTTGAGDSFAGGFLYRLSEGASLDECAEFANQCGARAVESLGATEWVKANPVIFD